MMHHRGHHSIQILSTGLCKQARHSFARRQRSKVAFIRRSCQSYFKSQQKMSSCYVCEKQPSCIGRLETCPENKGGCGRFFCAVCLDFSLAAENDSVTKPRITRFCKSCFKKLSNLGFDKNETVTILSSSNPTTSLVFVHGGGGCRFMFLPHARDLIHRGPYKCILLDLPGHGVKMDESLTLQTAID